MISIQSNATPSSMPAAEAALMRWNPQLSLADIDALRERVPGWPVVPAQQVAA